MFLILESRIYSIFIHIDAPDRYISKGNLLENLMSSLRVFFIAVDRSTVSFLFCLRKSRKYFFNYFFDRSFLFHEKTSNDKIFTRLSFWKIKSQISTLIEKDISHKTLLWVILYYHTEKRKNQYFSYSILTWIREFPVIPAYGNLTWYFVIRFRDTPRVLPRFTSWIKGRKPGMTQSIYFVMLKYPFCHVELPFLSSRTKWEICSLFLVHRADSPIRVY